LQIVQESPDDGLVLLYCDDEEKTAWPTYQLYRKIKNQYSDARGKLKGITFTDDRFSFPLQAADMVAWLVRREALLRFRDERYEFGPLFQEMTKQPVGDEKIFACGVAWCDKEQLARLGQGFKTAKKNHSAVQLSDLSE
jgi:hypothetical protein